ncbi:MAG: chemotaxis protein CheW [Verrucomicrobia bacterium]|nr:chemotaxis protein CheW [Verrucomicrobiota bacterium]
MNPTPPTIAASPAAVVNDCWNRIGVWGDRSCSELNTCVHCRNCAVYASAARELLDVEPPQDYLGDETEHFAHDRRLSQPSVAPHMMLRLGARWFALPAGAVGEVAEQRRVHPFPHTRSRAVLGVTNIRGSLVVCLSLARVLQLDESPAAMPHARRAYPRLLVVNAHGGPLALPADEVQGMHYVREQDLKPLGAPPPDGLPPELFRGGIAWRGALTPCLDDAVLFTTLNRHLA